MIVSFNTPSERRAVRLNLYKDDVFLIAHDAIKNLKITIPLEDLFASADQFTNFLIDNNISERDIMQYEIDDLKEEISDVETLYILLTISFIKLCALRIVNPNAENIGRALVVFCQEYEDFSDLLRQFHEKEMARHFESKRIDLLTYELRCLEKEPQTRDGLTVFSNIVDVACERLSGDSILPLEATLVEVNEKMGNQYNNEIKHLREARKNKSICKINIDKVNDIHDNPNVNIGNI